MDGEEIYLLIQCIATHLVGLLCFSFAIRLILREYRKTKKQSKQSIVVPRNVRYSAFAIYFCASFVIIGMWGLATPYICDLLQLEMPNELAYIWMRIFLVYFQSERLRNVLGYKQDSSTRQFGYPKGLFIFINAYLLFLSIFAVFVSIIFKTQHKHPGIEYYYKGCVQTITDIRVILVSIYALCSYASDWFVILLFYIKLRQINKLVSHVSFVSDTLKSILREFLGLALSMQAFSFVSVLVNFMLSDIMWLANLSTAIDCIWTIMAVRFMFQHNSDEFSIFKHNLSKYCGNKLCVCKYCCCICYCDKMDDIWSDVNVAMTTNDKKDNNKNKSNTDRDLERTGSGSPSPGPVNNSSNAGSTNTGASGSKNNGSSDIPNSPMTGTAPSGDTFPTDNNITLDVGYKSDGTSNNRDSTRDVEETVMSATVMSSKTLGRAFTKEDSVL